MNQPKFCVMGGGNGAIAMAGHLALMNFQVNLYNRSLHKTPNLVKTKEITFTGDVEGLGKINMITDNAQEACKGADVILVVIPANGHIFMAEKLAPILEDGQIVVLNPGRTGGALEVYEYLSKHTNLKNLIVAEAQSLVYACRAMSDTHVHVFQTKENVTVGALPARKTHLVLEKLNAAYGGIYTASANVWETGINNYGAIFHPVPTLMNVSRIEGGETFKYYTEGITKSVSNILENLDQERVAIGKALGVDTMSTLKWLETTYSALGETIEDAVKNVDAYRGIENPKSIDVRYIEEDVPYSLVPLESLAIELKIDVPVLSSVINIANSVAKKDFRKIGRTADKLGIKGLSIENMHKLVNDGDLGGFI